MLVPGTGCQPQNSTSDLAIQEEIMTDPLQFNLGARLGSVLTLLNCINSLADYSADFPILAMHSEHDTITACEPTKQFVQRAVSADKELQVFQNVRHQLHKRVRTVSIADSQENYRLAARTGLTEWSTTLAEAAEGGSSGSRWRLMKQIGSGSFGDIYLGVNCVSGEPVAVKLEPVTARHPQLEAEFKLYQLLNKTGTVGSPGVAKVMHFAKELRHNVLVMELLGPSLEELFNFCSRRFSVKTVLMLADQMLSVWNTCIGWVHQDVKPDNFTMGQGAAMQTVYLIDFAACASGTWTLKAGTSPIERT
uniref:Protein kinase domain-containing protein n=1 Tax=Macrostomum lignano TaxID=282301 RepID=A0A1I8F9G0_9PLAT